MGKRHDMLELTNEQRQAIREHVEDIRELLERRGVCWPLAQDGRDDEEREGRHLRDRVRLAGGREANDRLAHGVVTASQC